MKHEQDEHINTLEIRAVLKALMEYQDRTVGQCIVMVSDNSSVVAYINKPGTVS